ncbi:MAG TPA: ribokinase [Bacilli bacterium]|nr:ribokinase [Bacilli bacterium]
MAKVFVLGSINRDISIQADRFPQVGETVKGSGFFQAFGGKGSNQAIAAFRSGADVTFIGSVGNDAEGESFISLLRREGMNTDNIRVVQEHTGTAVITLAESNNTIIIYAGANNEITEEQIDKGLNKADKGDYLIIQFEIPLDKIIYASRAAKEKGMIVVINPAPCAYEIKDFIHNIDFIIPNETEYRILKENSRNQIELIPNLIVTLGKDGSQYIGNKDNFVVPSLKVKAVDTTAAGDTYVGYLIGSLSKGMSLKDSMKRATKAASITVTRLGAIPSIPYKSEVDK